MKGRVGRKEKGEDWEGEGEKTLLLPPVCK